MATLIRALVKGYHIVNDEYSDPRTKDWFLIGSPWKLLLILGFYHYFVKKLGPAIMENREPFNIDRIIQLYNVVQVVLCSWVVYASFTCCYGWTGTYSWICEPIDFSPTPEALYVAKWVNVYFILKVLDLFDTVFFILRKKQNQVTFLHVYHHTGMVLLGWIGVKYLAGGHGVFVGMLNSFVHAVMYTYYFITNYKPEYKKKIWWKKYITQLQMFQFFWLAVHVGQILLQPTCEYPKWAAAIFFPQNFFMFFLFWDFYKKAYILPKKTASVANGIDSKQIQDSNKST